jgi:L-ribulose-5-phosphate 3-epimerase
VEPLEIGVCTWSLGEPDLRKALEIVRSDLGLAVIQLGFMHSPPKPLSEEEMIYAVKAADVEVSATCVAFAGEDYGTIERIAATGGLVPDDAYEARLGVIRRAAETTAKLGARLLTMHVGFVPEDPDHPRYRAMVERTAAVADVLGRRRITLAMETGQESPQTLRQFIADVGRENVRVNFDPANMILYGVGEPVAALSVLKGLVAHVHMKDALWSASPRKTWGEEVVLGTGDADIPRVVSKLRAGGYTGPLVIEREVGSDPIADVQEAIDFLSTLL